MNNTIHSRLYLFKLMMSAIFSEDGLVKGKYQAYTIFVYIIGACILIAPQAAYAGPGPKPTGKEDKPQTWVEDSFEDFSDGIFDASGQNIYASLDGKIRTINRFDLNEDGWIDLLFPSTHNRYHFIPATLASVSPDRQVQASDLEVEGSIQAAVSDLNKDGYPDVVFCPNNSGIQASRQFLTIMWGGEDGWSVRRTNGPLPVYAPIALVLADLNHDGWEDIVTINRDGHKITVNNMRVFWGGEQGFFLTRYQDVDVRDVMDMTAGDFDSDGADDVALLKSDNSIDIFWATKSVAASVAFETTGLRLPGEGVNCISAADSNGDGKTDFIVGTNKETLYIVPGQAGRSWGKSIEVPSFNASNITLGDIDGDSYKDMVLSYSKQTHSGKTGERSDVHILWGDSKGFAASRSTSLEARYHKDAAIGDYDGDGSLDVAIAIYHGENSFSTNSIIYFGNGNRQFEIGKQGVPTTGAFNVITVPSSKGGLEKALFCNSYGGAVEEKVPVQLYLGGPDGFSTERMKEIPFRSGYEATSADFNADGYVDLMVLNALHGSQKLEEDTIAGANIFWGTPEGIDFEGKRTVLSEVRCWASSTADLNKDGYLDIVLGQYVYKDWIPKAIIYYGSKDGFDRSNRVEFDCEGRSTVGTIADYNKDGWLDMAFASLLTDKLQIFYGSPEGFSKDRIAVLELSRAIDLETADLNNDGWLDIIGCSYADAVTMNHDTGTTIFWGSPEGFRHWDTQWLPGFTPLGPTVADFDGDGFLDLFNPAYHGEISRESIPCYLYWGGPDGLHPRRRTVLINDSGAEALAADFDKDGLLDLAVSNHSKDGSHNTFSKIFYNDGDRFSNPRVEKIPTYGPHWGWSVDMGHIYNRSFEQFYESSIYQWKKSFKHGEVSFVAEIPDGTELKIAVRSASSKDKINDKEWVTVSNKSFSLEKEDRFLQYKAIFVSDNGDRFPVLDSVEIEIE